jgi:ribose transport system ATP-binding protein
MVLHNASETALLPPAAFSVHGVSKSYPGTIALNDVTLRIKSGEIHSIVGGNGSGKSTLVKILGGVLAADQGRLVIGDNDYDLTDFSPGRARRAGLHVVHQHRTVFNTLTIEENLAIGRGFPTFGGVQINWRAARSRAAELIERFDLRARPGDMVSSLGPAQQTMLEIARALQDQDEARGGIILLDEPTASLPAAEVELLLSAIKRYKAAGQSIVFISHRLEEVLAISDRVSALRDGNLVSTLEKEELNRESIVYAMVGELVKLSDREVQEVGDAPVALKAQGLTGGRVKDVDLVLRAGEIVGIAGLAGSGRSTLLRMLFGAQRSSSGSMTVAGNRFVPKSAADAVRAKIALVPEDRQQDAAFADMTVIENHTVAHIPEFVRLVVLG